MLKVGVLGAGYLGKFHISLLKEIRGFEVIGFHDPNVAISFAVSDESNLKAFTSEEELINACDALIIAATTTAHFSLAEKCLHAKKHIFIEKPLTETLQQAEKLIQLANQSSNIIQIGHVERFNPAFTAAKQYNLQPMFIESHRLAEFNPRGTDVSVILDLMIHDIDIILSIVNSPIRFIHASGVSIVSENPDIANARLEFENGCVANITASRISIRKERKMRIFQQDAYILIDFLNKITERFSLNQLDSELNPLSFIVDTGKERKIVKMDKPDIKPTNAIKAELESFLNSIQQNSAPVVSLQHGYDAMKVAYEIMQQIVEKEKSLKTPIPQPSVAGK